jgi:hypothetical protein
MDFSIAFVTGIPISALDIQSRDARLNFRELSVKVVGHEALTQQIHAMRLCLDAASSVVPAPVLLKRST